MNEVYIRQLIADDFDSMYQIWRDGVASAFSNSALSYESKEVLAKNFFYQCIIQQDRNFKIWGCFSKDVLVGWQSLLPCQSAPMLFDKFAESSTYISKEGRGKGLARLLLCHAIEDARKNSDLSYIVGYVSEHNLHVEKLVKEVGFVKIGPFPKSIKDDVFGTGNLCIWVVSL